MAISVTVDGSTTSVASPAADVSPAAPFGLNNSPCIGQDTTTPLDGLVDNVRIGPLASEVATLSCSPGTWSPTPDRLFYTWTRNGVTIPGATGPSVTPTASWYGDEVQAHVTATKAGYEPVTVHSNEVRVGPGAAPTSAAPAVSLSGGVLTSTAGVWSVAGVTIAYAWYDETADPGHASVLGTTASFTVPASGSYTVVVTATRAGYAPGTITRISSYLKTVP